MLKRGEVLYNPGEQCLDVYAVRSGSLKTIVANNGGREKIVGFHLGGELLGFDGIAEDAYTCRVVAVEDSTVCAISYRSLKVLCRNNPAIQEEFHRLMASHIVRERVHALGLATLRIEARIAAFLVDLSERHGKRGYSARNFQLRMSREELGSYLATTLESASRSMTALGRRGVIEVEGRDVRILDAVALRKCAGI